MRRVQFACSAVAALAFTCGAVSAQRAAPPENTRPDLVPLLSYLRCEPPVRRDQFDQAAKPEVLFALPESAFTGIAPSGSPTLPLEVWQGALAQVEVLVGQGYFALAQHYPAASKSLLLRRIAEAGWTIKRSTLAEQIHEAQAKLPGAHLIGVHTAVSNGSDIRRTITLVEAKQNFGAIGAIDRNGVTVWCQYSKQK